MKEERLPSTLRAIVKDGSHVVRLCVELARKVAQHQLELDEAVRAVQKEATRALLDEDAVARVNRIAKRLRLRSPSTAHALATIGFEIAKGVGSPFREACCAVTLADICTELGHHLRAVDLLHYSLRVFDKEQRKWQACSTLRRLAHSHEQLKEPDKAITYSLKALEGSAEIGDKKGERWDTLGLAWNYLVQGDYRTAKPFYENALRLAAMVRDRQYAESCHAGMGFVCELLGEITRAVEHWERAIEIARRRGDRSAEREWTLSLGGLWHSQGEFAKALAYFEQGLQGAQGKGDGEYERRYLARVGSSYLSLGDHGRALECYRKLREAHRTSNDERGEAEALVSIARVHESLGKHRDEIPYHEQAMVIHRRLEDTEAEGTDLANIGNCHLHLGEYDKAIPLLKRALDIAVEVGDRAGEGKRLNNLGSAHSSKGEYEKATQYFRQAASVAAETGDRESQVSRLSNLGALYMLSDEHKKAIESYENAIRVNGTLDAPQYEGSWLIEIGKAHGALGEHEKAWERFEKALGMARRNHDISGERDCIALLGDVHESRGDHSAAIECYQRALRMGQERDESDAKVEGDILARLGQSYLGMGEHGQARGYFERAHETHRAIGDRGAEARDAFAIGAACSSSGEDGTATKWLCEALRVAAGMKDGLLGAEALRAVVVCCSRIDDHAEVIRCCTEALRLGAAILEETKDSTGECLTTLGGAYQASGDYIKAIQHCEQALRLNEEVGARRAQGIDLGNLGLCYDALGDFRKAIRYMKKALEIARETGDGKAEGQRLGNIGSVYESLADYGAAMRYYQDADSVLERIGDVRMRTKAVPSIAACCLNLGNLMDAIQYYELAASLCAEVGDRGGEAKHLVDIGGVYSRLKDRNRARDYYEQALMVHREIDDTEGELEAAEVAALANVALARYAEARGEFIQAIKAARKLGRKEKEARLLASFGGKVYLRLSQYSRALRCIEKALATSERLGDEKNVGVCLGNMGNVYLELGAYRTAAAYHVRAVRVSRELGDLLDEAHDLGNLGTCYYALRAYLQAIALHKRAFRIHRRLGEKEHMAIGLGNIGISYGNIGELGKESSYLRHALKLAREIGSRHEEANQLNNLGVLVARLGDFHEARRYLEEAIGLHAEAGNLDSERIAWATLGDLYRENLDNKGEAERCYLRSLRLDKNVWTNTPGHEHRMRRARTSANAYKGMVALSLAKGSVEGAFGYLESGKSRSLLEQMAAGGAARSPRASLRDEALTMEQTMHYLRSVDGNLVIVEYFVDDADTTIFLLRADEEQLLARSASLSAAKLMRYALNFSKEVARFRHFGDIPQTWLELSRHLVEPVEADIREGETVCFVPDKILSNLPLHALLSGSGYLIEQNPVVYSPSTSLIRTYGGPRERRLETVAAFGVAAPLDPESVRSQLEDEARCVAKLFGARAVTGDQVTRTAVKRAIANKDVVHFSCHGGFSVVDPLSSGISFYQGERVTAREIFSWSLQAELVTLSACQTGITEGSQGGELIGLARAFLCAGASSVLVSLWSVDVYSPTELMLCFYRNLLARPRKSKVEALQEAQRTIKAIPGYDHPYHWAPFVLFGDWR